MSIDRWTMTAPGRPDWSWEFPRNPNKMTSPHPPKNAVIFSRAIGGPGGVGNGISRVLIYRQQPYEWNFGGDIRTEAHYQTFIELVRYTGVYHITDHFLRTWEIRIDSVDFNEEKNTPRNAWRFEYTVKAVIYGRVS